MSVASIVSVAGHTMLRELLGYASSGTATWTDATNGTDATQATTANKPTANTTAGGQSYPDFDGAAPANHDYLSASAATTGSTYSSSRDYLIGCNLRVDSQPTGTSVIVSTNTSGGNTSGTGLMLVNNAIDGRLNVASSGTNAITNARVDDGVWRRILVVYNGSTGVTTIYVNGVAQTGTATNAEIGKFLRTNTLQIGTQPEDTTRRFDGGLDHLFFVEGSGGGAITSQNIADLDAALADELNGLVFFANSGATAVGTTSLSVAYPTGVVAGDIFLLLVGNKYPTNTPTQPSGWTLLDQGTGGAGTAGADSGSTYCTVYYKVSSAGLETGSVSVTLTGSNSCMGKILMYRAKSGYTIGTPASSNGGDSTAGTAVSVTFAADPGIATDDMCVVGFAANTDARTYSAEAVASTGITYDPGTERNDSSTTNGDDMALVISDHRAASGTSSAAPVYTATASGTAGNQGAGGAVFVRLRASSGGGSFSLTAAQGSFTLSGQAALLTAQRLLSAALGSFTLGGQNANLNHGFTLVFSTGSFTLSGQAAALKAQRKLVAAQGSYSVTGQSIALNHGWYMPVGQGSFALTGQAANLRAQRKLALAQGSFALTGQSVILRGAHALGIGQGNYALAGQAVSLKAGRALAIGQGSFALTGQTAALKAARKLAAGQGSYTLSGQAVNLVYTPIGAFVLPAGQGSFALTGQAAALKAQRRLTAAFGSFTFTGEPVGLVYGSAGHFTLAASPGTYTFTGQASGLLAGHKLTAAQGAFALTGRAANLVAARRLVATQGSYSLIGQAVALKRGARLAAAQGSFSVTGQNVSFLRGRFLTASPGSYALSGQAAGFTRTRRLVALPGVFALTGQDVTFGVQGSAVVIAHDDGTVGKILRDASSVVLYLVDTSDVVVRTHGDVGLVMPMLVDASEVVIRTHSDASTVMRLETETLT